MFLFLILYLSGKRALSRWNVFHKNSMRTFSLRTDVQSCWTNSCSLTWFHSVSLCWTNCRLLEHVRPSKGQWSSKYSSHPTPRRCWWVAAVLIFHSIMLLSSDFRDRLPMSKFWLHNLGILSYRYRLQSIPSKAVVGEVFYELHLSHL